MPRASRPRAPKASQTPHTPPGRNGGDAAKAGTVFDQVNATLQPPPTPRNAGMFTKGRSGNPSGKAKAEIVEAVAEHPNYGGRPLGSGHPVAETTNTLKVACRKMEPTILRKLERMIKSPYFNKVRPEIVVRAAELVLAYGRGRPKQQMEMQGTGPLDFLAFLQTARQQLAALQSGGLLPREPWVPSPVVKRIGAGAAESAGPEES